MHSLVLNHRKSVQSIKFDFFFQLNMFKIYAMLLACNNAFCFKISNNLIIYLGFRHDFSMFFNNEVMTFFLIYGCYSGLCLDSGLQGLLDSIPVSQSQGQGAVTPRMSHPRQTIWFVSAVDPQRAVIAAQVICTYHSGFHGS